MSIFTFKKSVMVGVSLSQKEARLLCLKFIKGAPIIENFAITSVSSDWQSVARSIRQLVEETECEGCDAAIALPFSQVIYKKISLPSYLNQAECQTEIATNTRYYFSDVSDPLYVDYVVLPSGDINNQTYLLVAARVDSIKSYLYLMKQAGLNVTVVDVDRYALARGICYAHGQKEMSEVWVAHIEDEFLTCFLLKNADIVAHHHCIIGRDNSCLIAFQQIQSMMQQLPFLSQIERIPTLFLTGKFLYFEVLRDQLVSQLNLLVEIINPFRFVSLSSKIHREKLFENAPSLIVNYGLALRGMLDVKH